jgi:hypothetical protein
VQVYIKLCHPDSSIKYFSDLQITAMASQTHFTAAAVLIGLLALAMSANCNTEGMNIYILC